MYLLALDSKEYERIKEILDDCQNIPVLRKEFNVEEQQWLYEFRKDIGELTLVTNHRTLNEFLKDINKINYED